MNRNANLVKHGYRYMNSLKERLDCLEAKTQLKGYEIAKKLGISQGYYSEIKSGKKHLKASIANLIALTFGLNKRWLLTGEGEMFADPEAEAFSMLARAQEAALIFKNDQFVPIPKVTGWLSAGPGSWEMCPEPESYYAFRADWIKRKGQPGNMVLMEVHGMSMYPTLREHDYVLVDQGQKKPRDDKLFAIMIGDEALVKRLRIQMDGRLLIVSDNRSESDPLGPYAPEEVTILGRVIWLGREL